MDYGERAFKVAARLSFPRLVGTAGEAKAARRARRSFEEAGLAVEEDWFTCSDFAINVAARWALVPTGIALALAAALNSAGLFAPALVAAAAALLPALYIASRSQSGFSGLLSKSLYKCANIVGRPPGTEGQTPRLVLMAHYDSKSQRFPIWLRIGLFIVCGFGSIGLVLFVIACAIVGMTGAHCLFTPWLLPAALVLLAADFAMVLNTVGNHSDGAIDNATGVGIITEIAERLLADEIADRRFWVLAVAAEEIGLRGARALLEMRGGEMSAAYTRVINFDGCGSRRSVDALTSYGLFPRRAPEHMVAALRQTVREEGVYLRTFYIPLGMATDQMPLARAGFEGIDLIGVDGVMHTTADRMDRVKPATLADYVKAGLGLSKYALGLSIKLRD